MNVTREYKLFWLAFLNGLLLMAMASLDLLSKPMRLVLWLFTAGHSSKVVASVDRYFPDTEISGSSSPDDPPIAFYYHSHKFTIRVNSYFFDNFSIKLSKEKYDGEHKWIMWAWDKGKPTPQTKLPI